MTTTPTPRMLRGDEAHVYETHHADLERSVRRAVRGSDAIVQDACAHAWLQFLRHQPDRETVGAWLHVVAVRHAWQLANKELRTVHLDGLPAVDDLLQAAPLTDQVDAREALRAVAALPQPQRECLSLVLSGHSYAEVTAATGRSYTNVNKQLTRARRHLRLVHDANHDA